MANAKRDQNDRAVALGVSSTDAETTIPFHVDPITDYLIIEGSVGSLVATVATKDKRDQNDVPTSYGVSSSDGITLVPIRTDSMGRLLITNV